MSLEILEQNVPLGELLSVHDLEQRIGDGILGLLLGPENQNIQIEQRIVIVGKENTVLTRGGKIFLPCKTISPSDRPAFFTLPTFQEGVRNHISPGSTPQRIFFAKDRKCIIYKPMRVREERAVRKIQEAENEDWVSISKILCRKDLPDHERDLLRLLLKG